MKGPSGTDREQIEEILAFKQIIQELERSESGHKWMDKQILFAGKRLQYLPSSLEGREPKYPSPF